MDEQEEIRSSYMKNMRFIDGKFYLNAMFNEIANSTIEQKKYFICQQKPLLLRQQNKNSSDSVQKMTAIASIKKAQKKLSNPTGENSTGLKRMCCYDGNYRGDRQLNETALNES